MGLIFREANHTFVFDQVGFVTELLERCQAMGFDLYQEVAAHLYASERSGVRTSVPGKPSPREIETRDKADEILSRLSRLSPAYELFDSIKKSALADIDRAKRDAEAFDD